MTMTLRISNSCSASNIFFKIERKRILFGEQITVTRELARKVIEESKANANKKRPHRKTHEKVGFHDLTRLIARRWKEVDSQTKDILEAESQIEKDEYAKLLKEYREEEEQLSLITAVDPTREQKETSKGNSPSASVAGQSLIAPLGQELTILQLVTNLVTSPTARNQLEGTDLNELAELLRGNPQQLLQEQQQYTASTTTTNDSSRDLILLVIRMLASEQGTTESDLLRALRQVRPTSNHY